MVGEFETFQLEGSFNICVVSRNNRVTQDPMWTPNMQNPGRRREGQVSEHSQDLEMDLPTQDLKWMRRSHNLPRVRGD